MDASKPKVPKGKRARQLYGQAARMAAAVSQPDTAAQQRHAESKQQYPHLAMSNEEYVLQEVHRHPIGLVSIWLLISLLVAGILAALSLYALNIGTIGSFFTTAGSTAVVQMPAAASLMPLVLFLCALFILGGVVATIVYEGNKFYITNEAIFQYLQTSLFNTQTQIVNLINVEDVSQDQQGLLQQVLNYGTLKVSTQGEETTYHFYFVSNPGRIVNIINDASEKAVLKMQGVPVSEH